MRLRAGAHPRLGGDESISKNRSTGMPAESHMFLFEGQQAMIGNSHAMGVATGLAQHLRGTTERVLGINHRALATENLKHDLA